MRMSGSNGRELYPATPRVDTAEVLAGVRFSDPYRWLEEETPAVRRWQRAQARKASAFADAWPGTLQLREQVRRFNIERRVWLPRYAGGRWFRMHRPHGIAPAKAVVSDAPFSTGRVLYDPVAEGPARPPFLSWIAPSPDGHTLAVGICGDGSERNFVRLIDVSSGRVIEPPPPQALMDNWTGGAHWLPDSSGFFFTGLSGPPGEFVQRVFLHRRQPNSTTVLLGIPWTQENEWRMVSVSRDGRYAIAIERLMNPIPVAVARLDGRPLQWRPFVTSLEGTLAGHLIGDEYIAVTDVGAPRGRLVSVPLTANRPDDPFQWHELVAESDAVLRTVTPVGDALYLTELHATYARARVVDSTGRNIDQVSLPGNGALGELPFPLMNLVPKGHPEKFLFAFSTLTRSWGIYVHQPTQRVSTLRAPEVELKDAVVEDCWATSSDGTQVPYHLVHRREIPPGPRPTLIYVYGGFNVAEVPQFPGPIAAFIAAGGVFVHAHLRGGGEFGLDWWRGGRMAQKQNSFEDLYAIAEHLIATSRATAQTLALTGGSNGGLVAGVALTQRPELWKAVVPRVPILDLIGACRESYGRMIVKMEFADITRPEEVRRLASFSPYHLVRDDATYPSVFIDAGDTDPRCPPWHARKFAARLQARSNPDSPVLLHVWENVGHGWATDPEVAVREHTEWLAFVMRSLAMEVPPK